MHKNLLLWTSLGYCLLMMLACNKTKPPKTRDPFVGSESCRDCHEKFYQLWATSHHGLAMQPYTAEFAQANLTPQTNAIVIASNQYRIEIQPNQGWVTESGPQGKKQYPIAHVMGGKNVYYFLTRMQRGRLQTLPVAYDVRRQEWFDTPASGVRHFPGVEEDQPIDWKDWPYTFNTACYSCHVSQLSTNYDLKADTYHTTWKEPGINCETCHGQAQEHIQVCRQASEGQVPADLKIIRGGRDFSAAQNNALCSTCHAKLMSFSTSFLPGDRFFDHFDLVTLEHRDFYPDGRDLGENYTFTLWRMSPCAKSGQLDCLHCHTSSGRFKFKTKGQENNACLPCHKERVENAQVHTHHKADSQGNLCISCHMPMTEFARMRRSDHSMRPPTPMASIQFQSPNACNLCHKDQNAAWSNQFVRKWHKDDYQAAPLHRASLIQAGRDRDWKKLTQIIAYLERKDRDEVFTTSLIRLLNDCSSAEKWPVIRKAVQDPSPLVRAAAAAALAQQLTPQHVALLVEATRDTQRLVRLRAAESLSRFPVHLVTQKGQQALERANAEYEKAMQARPDDSMAHYNLGNFYLNRRKLNHAAKQFELAIKLRPDNILPMVNVALVYARRNEQHKAKAVLSKALQIDPHSPEANFNMGLLKAELQDLAGAQKHFRTALQFNPQFPDAAYNLGVLLAKTHLDEALSWLGKAHALSPWEPKYGYTYAFFLRQKNKNKAIDMLRDLIEKQPKYMNAYFLLGDIYEKDKARQKALALYKKALSQGDLPAQIQFQLRSRIEKLGKQW